MNAQIKQLTPSASECSENTMQVVAQKIKGAAATIELAKQAPILCVFSMFAIGGLYFMERRDTHWIQMLERGDTTTAQRIEQCHAVQKESSEAMKAVAAALQHQAIAFKELSIRLEKH